MKDCNNCDNRKNGVCEFSSVCVIAYNNATSIRSTPSHWKAKEGYIEPDTVNHPSHYETGKFECFDVMVEAIGLEDVKGFCLCNAFKYIYRCTKKHQTPVEDVKKAIWYLNKFVELEGENGEQS
jgi:hypothetical protein